MRLADSAVENLEPFLKPGANVLDVGEHALLSHRVTRGACRALFCVRARRLDDLPKLTLSLSLAGSGSGYLCGIFHSLVQPGGTVLGIDHLDGLVTMARRNLANDPSTAPALCDDQDSPVDPKVPNSKTMQVIKADGRMGAPKEFLPHGGWQVSWTLAAMGQTPIGGHVCIAVVDALTH